MCDGHRKFGHHEVVVVGSWVEVGEEKACVLTEQFEGEQERQAWDSL